MIGVVNSMRRYPICKSSVAASAFLIAICFVAVACGGAGAAETLKGDSGKAATDEAMDVAGYFPDLEGWTKEGAPGIYDSETLYEYINGAADLYINFDFQELAALNYERGEDQGIIIDIYRHSTPRNAFGIYSQERRSGGAFIDIGTQGYHDTGILNFFQGNYYVKLAGFYLGEDDERLLKSVAKDVSGRLGGVSGFPKALAAFPDSGKVRNSERYVAISFMGHGFLHSAFVAGYVSGENEFRLFIIEADDKADADAMVESYLKLARDKGEAVASEGALHRFVDPYQKSRGAVNLKSRGRCVWGLLSDDTSLCDFYIRQIEGLLKKSGLLEEAEPKG